jgi:hypothetical protein
VSEALLRMDQARRPYVSRFRSSPQARLVGRRPHERFQPLAHSGRRALGHAVALSAQFRSDDTDDVMPERLPKHVLARHGSCRVTALTRSIDLSKDRIVSTPVASAWRDQIGLGKVEAVDFVDLERA